MSEYHCRICALPLERKGNVWACTATASHDYHRPLTLAEEMADLRADLDAARAELARVTEAHRLAAKGEEFAIKKDFVPHSGKSRLSDRLAVGAKNAAALSARLEGTREPICGVVCSCGPNGEPIACGYVDGHDGAHSWASLPTFTERLAEATRRANLIPGMSAEIDALRGDLHLATHCAECARPSWRAEFERQVDEAERLRARATSAEQRLADYERVVGALRALRTARTRTDHDDECLAEVAAVDTALAALDGKDSRDG